MDGRNAKTRLMVVEILTQAKVTPASVGIKDFLDYVQQITEYVGSDIDGYLEMVAAIPIDEPAEMLTVAPVVNDTVTQGYL
jgi:hypothetical protein